jgi:hypothetical protein
MKTSELTGMALDWAVAKCEGEEYRDRLEWDGIGQEYPAHKYSTDWAQGGPIIEREKISVGNQEHIKGQPNHSNWYATERKDAHGFGQTPLIAAMRCYVASKIGDEVELPKELT